MIHRLVHAFYHRIRSDPELGPIFDRAVTDWQEHLAKMCDFWSSVVLMSGRYKGRPMIVHARLPGIGDAQFDRWLEVFRQTASETCPPPAAGHFIDRAERIAQSLLLGIALHRQRAPRAVAAGH
jgi:hemoglobin